MADRVEAKLDALDARLQTIVAYIQNGVKDNKTAIKDHIDKQDIEVQNLHTRINKTREQFEAHSKEVMAALESIRIETIRASNKVWVWLAMTCGAALIGYIVSKVVSP